MQGCDSVVILNSFLSIEFLITRHFLFLSEAAVYTKILLKNYLKNIAKLRGKNLLRSLVSLTFAGIQPATLFEKKAPSTADSCESYKILKYNLFNHTAGGSFSCDFLWFTETGFE